MAVSATDRLMLGYVALATGVLLWHRAEIPLWPLLLLAHALVLVLMALLRRAPDTEFSRFFRDGYPLPLTMLFYTEAGVIAGGVGLVHDQAVQRWEQALFGGQVSVSWHQAMPHPALSWVMHIAYGSFYLLTIGVPILVFLRSDRETYARLAFLESLSLYLCYTVFLLFPVAGPRYFFGVATGTAAEVLPAKLVHTVLEGGSAWGTAFPSSHVAAAWVAVAALWRRERRLCLLLAPVTFLVPFGTVYGQFHYGVDALAGAALAVVLVLVGDRVRELLSRPVRVAPAFESQAPLPQ